MRSFNDAYQNSKNTVLNEKSILIDRQKNDVVNAIKKEYGISSFNSLSESEKKSYRSMVLEMWDPKEGLTKKGEKFLLESKRIITVDSTPEQIKSYFEREALESVKSKVAGNISQGRFEEIIRGIKSTMDEMHQTKISVKEIKSWLQVMLAEENNRMLRSFKLN